MDEAPQPFESPVAQPRVPRPASRRGIFGWIMFDPAAQPYFTLITTFVFAPYFVSAVASDPVLGQSLWGYATGLAGLAIALTSPFLGAVADASGRRKPWIAVFTLMTILASAALWFVEPGRPDLVPLALIAFAIGTIGVEYASVFTNAMMPDLVPPERLGRLSGTGWAAGYAGGLVSLALVLGLMAADPETGRTLFGLEPLFGLDPESRAGDRASGPLTAIWFAALVLPLFLFTPDVPKRMGIGAAFVAGRRQLGETLKTLPKNRPVFFFLLANMIYTDGLIALFAFGGIYAAGTFGWGTIEIGIFGILLTLTGTVGAFAGGRLDDRIGPRAVICGALMLLMGAAIGILSIGADHMLFVVEVAGPQPGDGLFASLPERLYIGLGIVIGVAAGPLQAASRSMLVRLAPPGQAAQFFGLFALTGKITSFIGPTMVGLATMLTGSQRAGLVPLLAFFAIGLLLLRGVRVPAVSAATSPRP
ncbi:MFS transporter [Methylobrevis pamukkalensis]|uniref:Vacuole effluxer Atg22 like protein n=1 Tax=Methylobrevis pamukkalensis TaxID=1439726 RepID=A0A1E3H9C0_9HYPH|nr:MFS transporter [Methylobrevis pamukkalensis]ODN72081.1 Vacuole effluxer Atg22 like protein [Methylobrevis pamukkalensis]